MSVIHAGTVRLYKDVSGTYTPFACGTNVSINVTRETRDTTCKDSTGDYRDVAAGLIGGTASMTGLYSEDSTNLKADSILDDLTNGTAVTIQYSVGTTGTKYYRASAIVTNWSLEAGNVGENATYSAEFQITGAISHGDIA